MLQKQLRHTLRSWTKLWTLRKYLLLYICMRLNIKLTGIVAYSFKNVQFWMLFFLIFCFMRYYLIGIFSYLHLNLQLSLWKLNCTNYFFKILWRIGIIKCTFKINWTFFPFKIWIECYSKCSFCFIGTVSTWNKMILELADVCMY